MKPVLLSHDSEVLLCSVPDEVAEDLEAYCLRFACDWLWHSPEAKKYHRTLGVVYGAQDFLDYLTPMSSPTGRVP